MQQKIVIVGAGASGIAMLNALVKQINSATIFLIDPIPPGHGFAFNGDSDLLLCNTSPETMSVDDSNPYEFVSYLKQRKFFKEFPPRHMYRDYIKEAYVKSIEIAKSRGIFIVNIIEKVHSIVPLGNKSYNVQLSSGVVNADIVIVAADFSCQKVPKLLKRHENNPNVIVNPYGLSPNSGLPQDEDILILGSKLSAIDAALLFSGTNNRITMLSPSGELPSVRTATPLTTEPIISVADLDDICFDEGNILKSILSMFNTKFLDLGLPPLTQQISFSVSPFERLKEEVCLAETRQNYWQLFTVDFVTAVNSFLMDKPASFKALFLRECTPIFGRYLGAFSLQNAYKILELFKQNRLVVQKGELRDINIGTSLEVTFDNNQEKVFDKIVCATGYKHISLSSCQGKIFLSQEDILYGTAVRVLDSLQIEGLSGVPENIWVIGVNAYPKISLVNAMYTSIQHAYFVAAQLVRS